ncbi:MAG: hypothetical protein Q9209_005253 [Squamulea sp. 1 TL-2023]
MSTPKSSPNVASRIQLTFGIELEHILAFHSSLLAPLLPADTRIVKDIPCNKRKRLRQTTSLYQLTRPLYHGWGVTTPTIYPAHLGHDWHNKCLGEYGYRGYADEILRMEQHIFWNMEKEVVVHDGQGKMQNFGKWYLTTDTSLAGATPEDLAAIIGEDQVRSRQWDSGPVELVSRVLDVDDVSSYKEIEQMFEILGSGVVGRNGYKAFADRWCGLHVHIGLSLSQPSMERRKGSEYMTFPLTLLQHLAYITIIYEPTLSLLHPPNRRPSHRDAKTDLLGNREGFYAEPDYSTIDWDSVPDSGYASGNDSDASDNSGGILLKFPTDPKYRKDKGTPKQTQTGLKGSSGSEGEDALEIENSENQSERLEPDDPNSEPNMRKRARTLIFPPPSSHKSHPMTLVKLVELMCTGNDRLRLINWTYLLRDPDLSSPTKFTDKGLPRAKGPQTLEFRQHEACFDAAGVKCWVLFCAALVRWAERGALAYEENFGEREGGEFVRGRDGGDGEQGARGNVSKEEREMQEKKWDEEEEEWFQGYYGRGKLGIRELVEGIELSAEMEKWVEGRVQMWKVEEERDEDVKMKEQ